MLDHTRSVYAKTKRDIDLALALFQFGTQILYITYLICVLLCGSNIWYLHLALLIISSAFLLFDLVTTSNIRSLKRGIKGLFGNKEQRKRLAEAKKQRKSIKRVKFAVAHTIKLLVLTSSLYPIIVSPFSVHPLLIISTTIMAFVWVMQILFEILWMILTNRGELFMEAMRADVEFITKPINSVKSTIKKFMGKDIHEDDEPAQSRSVLGAIVNRNGADRSERGEKLTDWLDSYLKGFGRKKRNNNEDKKDDEAIILSADEVKDKTEV